MRPNLFNYTDYRVFLTDFFNYKKNCNSGWSYRSWSNNLGIKSNASLLKIINGDREIGNEIKLKLLRYFSFTEDETMYFEDLIRLSKFRKDSRLSHLIFKNLAKEHSTKHYRALTPEEFKKISNWIYFILSSLSRRSGIKNDAEWISQNFIFNTEKEEIQTIIDDMLDKEILHLDKSKNMLVSSAKSLRAYEGLSKSTDDMKKIHTQLLEIAKECINNHQQGDHKIILHGFSLNVSQDDIPAMNEMIYEFFDELTQKFSVENTRSAYQLQLQCFPLTKT